MKTYKILISGMSCNHCVMNLSKILSKIEQLIIKHVKINEALIETENIDAIKDELSKLIDKAGYQLTEIIEI